MDWKEFAASVIGNVLSWPVVALTVALLLLQPIRKLIGRVTIAKGFGGEFQFAKTFESMEENVDEVLESVEKKVDEVLESKLTSEQPEDLETHTRSNSPENKVGPIAEQGTPDPIRNPTGAIIMSWKTLAKALEDLIHIKAGRGRPTRNHKIIIEQLRRNEAVSQAFSDSAQDLLALRNQVAHGEVSPTQGAAHTYVERARQLEMVARGIIALEKIDLDKPASSISY
ncbi:hypothetical protein [Paeniglutamicibacter sp.]|uniref:hypothetical protein n=1 Tax=Paeniglutamicibacter sp. TaxID=1934391 RepID=UPI0039899EA5